MIFKARKVGAKLTMKQFCRELANANHLLILEVEGVRGPAEASRCGKSSLRLIIGNFTVTRS